MLAALNKRMLTGTRDLSSGRTQSVRYYWPLDYKSTDESLY